MGQCLATPQKGRKGHRVGIPPMNCYYYFRDHLGSVREMCDSSGNIVSRLSYDPYGRVTVVSGANLPTKQYANYYAHAASGLNLTKYRAFDSNTGRWLSCDPI